MSPDLSWTFSPGVLIGAAIVLAVYVRRWRAVRYSSSPRAAAEAPVWRLCCFAGSVLVAVAALVSPLDALADQLFFAHMVQHMLLLDLAPILGDPRLHEGDPAAGHARGARSRAPSRAARASRVRGRCSTSP